ncbi:hypothetical protein J22TS1_43300 [Siminovitchia terrae]|uniref:hypothetical protein n=1 Tax=Siminovitchia terrae TaxID=1914933 RepID=UPI001B1B2383|nr:hypothetical protein [Siminovitchia terrae]GIN93279.1 hypothetical protein J22TS1_43300 [Siminovitchia terrae]
MSRKNRHIAGFDDVANRESNNNINEKVIVNINENNNFKNDDKENIDPIDKIINDNKKKEKTHILKGIYFEREVAAAIDRLGRTGGRGIKSQVVNEAVKQVFKEKGWM